MNLFFANGIMCSQSDEKARARKSGSPSYCPPELTREELHTPLRRKKLIAKNTPPRDAWGVGCVLYELLTGQRLPWKSSKSLQELYQAILSTTKTAWFPEPEDRTSLLHCTWRLLHKKPSQRLSIIEAEQLYAK